LVAPFLPVFARQQQLTDLIQNYPKASGQQPYLTNDSNTVLRTAESYLKYFGDAFVALEHLLLGLAKSNEKAGQLMRAVGCEEQALIKTIRTLRGPNNVTDQNAEAKYQSLGRYANNLNALAKAGKIADRNEHQAIFLLCTGKNALAPDAPVDRILAVQGKVRGWMAGHFVGCPRWRQRAKHQDR